MTTDTEPQTVLFPDLFDKPLFAKFNQEQASSDGGAVLLKAAERVYGLVKAFARCLSDKRAPEKIRHTLADLMGQRIHDRAFRVREIALRFLVRLAIRPLVRPTALRVPILPRLPTPRVVRRPSRRFQTRLRFPDRRQTRFSPTQLHAG